MAIHKREVFEGTLVPVSWDRHDHVNQSSLYTQDDEDIILEHDTGMKKFIPYLNQKVRVSGKIVSTRDDGRKLLVNKISRVKNTKNESYDFDYDEADRQAYPAA